MKNSCESVAFSKVAGLKKEFVPGEVNVIDRNNGGRDVARTNQHLR